MCQISLGKFFQINVYDLIIRNYKYYKMKILSNYNFGFNHSNLNLYNAKHSFIILLSLYNIDAKVFPACEMDKASGILELKKNFGCHRVF